MAINDIKYIKTELHRENIENTLIDLGRLINEYAANRTLKQESLEDFFTTFYEGDTEIQSTEFFVQTRLIRGRAGISYKFNSRESDKGELKITIFDNGENIPQLQLDNIYSKIKQHVSEKNLIIIEEGTKKEY